MALSLDSSNQRRGRRRGRSRRALSEINVTPLVDVMLVLLIIFMISAPLLTAGVPVELPKTEAGALNNQNQPLTVSIREDGTIFLENAQVPFAAFAPRMRALAASGPAKPVYVRADGRAPYAVVARVMASLSQSGFTSIGLLTDTGGPSSGLDQTPATSPAPAGRDGDALMSGRADDRRPALAASAALHVIVLTAGLIAWPWLSKPIHLGEVVPVTLITSPDASNMKPAVEAPTPTPAASEEPTPQASPLPPAPVEAPVPTPTPTVKTPPQPHPKTVEHPQPQPKPAPTPKPTPTPKAVAQPKPTPPPPKPLPPSPPSRPSTRTPSSPAWTSPPRRPARATRPPRAARPVRRPLSRRGWRPGPVRQSRPAPYPTSASSCSGCGTPTAMLRAARMWWSRSPSNSGRAAG